MRYKILKFFYRVLMYQINRLNKYLKSFFNFILPNLSFLITKRVKYRRFPIFNQKTYLVGAGNVEIGENCMFGFKPGGFYRGGCIEIQPRYINAKIKIGNNVSTNNNLFFCAANYIEIGDDTLIGQYITIMDYEAHGVLPNIRREVGEIGKVIIGKNVWIGNNVTILKNSEIGDNTIVATGAVVAGKFTSNVIIGGVPAKVIKSL